MKATEKVCGDCKELVYHLMWCEPRKQHVTGVQKACRKFVQATIEDRLHCYYCNKKYKKITELTFKPDCDCLKKEVIVTIVTTPIKYMIEPCCCGCHHEKDAKGKYIPIHHKDSRPKGFCECCSCEKCRKIVKEYNKFLTGKKT